jgi:hypothetical protein
LKLTISLVTPSGTVTDHHWFFENGEDVPLPEVGDEFFLDNMDRAVTVAKRRFIYNRTSEVHVWIYPKD